MENGPVRVASVNLAQVREIALRGKMHSTGIWKVPVQSRIKVSGESLEGDTQADLKVHGGPLKAVYTYSKEDYLWWEALLGRPLEPGTFGENLTLKGIEVNEALIGERWRIGTAEFEVTQPRQPCWKLGVKMEDRKFPKRFSEANRAGAYLSIKADGEVGAGDTLTVVSRPDHPVTIGLMAYLIYNNVDLARLVRQLLDLDVDLSPEEWDEVLSAVSGS